MAKRVNGRDQHNHMKAHRVAWLLNYTTIPKGLCVLHKCDNPRYVNPTHLFVGTHKDNFEDMHNKGRGSPPPIHHGENHPSHRLTWKQVQEIRALYARNPSTYFKTYSMRKLARMFHVSDRTIFFILHEITWKDKEQI